MVLFSLEEVLKPLASDFFFREVWGKTYIFQKGSDCKFQNLLPWSAINRILTEHRLDHPRLRLAKEGQNIPAASFLDYHQSRRGSQIARLRSVDLTNLLREGATLIIDAIDEAHTPLRILAENLEKTFHEYVQVNAYAGWGKTIGFDLHWDDHDVFVLQMEGRKAWKIYGQSRRSPLFRDKAETFKPPQNVIWEGILEQGDLLYIPRGWWHVATAIGEPTLHLTFGINNPTGIDFLNWLTETLVESETFRMDLPRFSGEEERTTHLNELRTILFNHWNTKTLETFTKERDALARQRPHLSLPHAATSEIIPDRDDIRLRCSCSRNPEFEVQGDGKVTKIKALGKLWQFDSTAEPLLRTLLNGQVISIGDLKKQFAASFSSEDILTILRELLKEGLLNIVG